MKGDFVEFEDECPQCGEQAEHRDGHLLYAIRCYNCKFTGTWKSLDEFVDWCEDTRDKRMKNESRRAKRKAKQLIRYDDE